MDDKFYNNVLRRVKGYVYRINPSNKINPEELISEAYLYGLPLNEDVYFKWIIRKSREKVRFLPKVETEVSDQRYCKHCKEVLNASCFRCWHTKGYLIYDSFCYSCRNNYLKVYRKIIKISRGIKIKINRGVDSSPDFLNCNVCKEAKPKEDFYIKQNKAYNRRYYISTCSKCENEKNKNSYKKRCLRTKITQEL